jgi:hypothetical protein
MSFTRDDSELCTQLSPMPTPVLIWRRKRDASVLHFPQTLHVIHEGVFSRCDGCVRPLHSCRDFFFRSSKPGFTCFCRERPFSRQQPVLNARMGGKELWLPSHCSSPLSCPPVLLSVSRRRPSHERSVSRRVDSLVPKNVPRILHRADHFLYFLESKTEFITMYIMVDFRRSATD